MFRFLFCMILTLDIGNSSTKVVLFEENEVKMRYRFETERDVTIEDLSFELEEFVESKPEVVAISSVVREVRETYTKYFEGVGIGDVHFIDHHSELGFEIDYFPPENCGPDRLVAAYAGLINTEPPLIVCDFGTATTIDLINSEGIYKGGIIAPGIETMSEALYNQTSRLPKVEVKPALKVVGDSTEASIRSGIYYGYLGLVDGIITRMKAGIQMEVPVIATGGFAKMIANGSDHIDEVDMELIPKGLRHFAETLVASD